MSEERISELIKNGRLFMKDLEMEGTEDWESDQDKKLPQPPLVKAAMTDSRIDLPRSFENLNLTTDVMSMFVERKSSRIYDREAQLSLLELSWLLWSTQGVKSIRGKKYATIRTVACGGARHEFECYFFARNIETLEDGLYHYLPMEHAVECLKTRADLEQNFGKTMEQLAADVTLDQTWVCRANILFLYSMVAYRAEWRYGIYAHRVALIDAGHITGNLYLACSAANLGTCAIAAVDPDLGNKLFGLDGEEEFIFYAATAGKVRPEDLHKEKDIYAFVSEQGL